MEYQEPSDADKELTQFVSDHCDRWRNHRDQNYLDLWLEYERIYRGIWDDTDKTRESERSRVITPGTQQAVETRHAEIMEAIFGQGDFFDIEDNLQDVDGNKLDVEALKAQLAEDFKKDKIRKSIDQIELMAEIYGTGIGEIIVKTEKEYVPTTRPIPGSPQAAIGVEEKDRIAVKINPINPKNFLFDPNGSSIEDCMGVAVEKFVSIHKVVENIEKGVYRQVKIGFDPDDENLDPTQELMQFKDEKVRLLTYYGLVPREYLKATETEPVEELFPEDDATEDYSDMVEAIVVIANGDLLLKAEENPYMMKDRPIIAYQDDTVPNRLLGRGTVEKAYNMQKATDAQIRSHLDSLALTTSPMIAMDATRLPRGAKFEVKPGKAVLTNGSPTEVLMPFKFGNTDGQNLQTAQVFQQLLLQATGTLDANGMVSNVSRDANSGGISMAVASIIKKYKRTLTNFQEDFLIPFVKKAAYRYMQFDPERYPTVDYNFIPTATLGIIAREYEQQQFISLLQTLGPNTPVMPLILKGIVGNSSFTNRYELMAALDQMSQPDPQAQQLSLAQQQLALQAAQAQIALQTTQAEQNRAEATKAMVEAQLMPAEVQAKTLAASTQNLPNSDEKAKQEFDRRVKLAELMLKEADIKNKSKIVEMQMAEKNNKISGMEEDFLNQLTKQLTSAQTGAE